MEAENRWSTRLQRERAWFNTTETTDVYIKVYTDEPDDTLHNLSVSGDMGRCG